MNMFALARALHDVGYDRVIDYDHPVFSGAGLAAQERWSEISGHNRTHYCGAYWRWGFHEDGAWSGLRAAGQLGTAGPTAEASEPAMPFKIKERLAA
mgnify:CR=1 FL=1